MNELEHIKELISNNFVNEAINCLLQIADSKSLPKIINSLLLLKARSKEILNKERLGVFTVSTEMNNIIHSLLEIVDELNDEINLHNCSEHTSINSPNVSSFPMQSVFDELIIQMNQFDSLTYDLKEDLYLKNIIFQSKLKEKLNTNNEYLKIVAERLFYGEEIYDVEINYLFSVIYDEKQSWIEKYIIISAVTLHLFKNLNPNLIEVLINFILTFEENVWKKALVSLILVLRKHENRILLFPKLINKLEKLREINTIQEGLRKIEYVFQLGYCEFMTKNMTYDSNTEYWKDIRNWFTPFYGNNPILISQKSKFPNIKNIHLLPELLVKNPHITNLEKYSITLNIENISDSELIKMIDNYSKDVECTDDHEYDSFILDYYCFGKYYSQNIYTDIFNTKKTIYDSSLSNIVSNDYNKNLYLASISKAINNKEEELSFLLQAIKLEPTGSMCNFCRSISILVEIKDFKRAGEMGIYAYEKFGSGFN